MRLRTSVAAYENDKLSMKYREWQFGLAISHRINCLVPYAGIKWAHAQLDMDNANVGIILYNLKTRKDVGYALGVTLTDCCKKSLTLEARFADEKALYVNGQIRSDFFWRHDDGNALFFTKKISCFCRKELNLLNSGKA